MDKSVSRAKSERNVFSLANLRTVGDVLWLLTGQPIGSHGRLSKYFIMLVPLQWLPNLRSLRFCRAGAPKHVRWISLQEGPCTVTRVYGGQVLNYENSRNRLSCILAAVFYGILHDQITARICVEYFTIGHPIVFGTETLLCSA